MPSASTTQAQSVACTACFYYTCTWIGKESQDHYPLFRQLSAYDLQPHWALRSLQSFWRLQSSPTLEQQTRNLKIFIIVLKHPFTTSFSTEDLLCSFTKENGNHEEEVLGPLPPALQTLLPMQLLTLLLQRRPLPIKAAAISLLSCAQKAGAIK